MQTVKIRYTSESEAFNDFCNYNRIGSDAKYRFVEINGYKQEVWEVIATGKV